jgi:hypothetical protein
VPCPVTRCSRPAAVTVPRRSTRTAMASTYKTGKCWRTASSSARLSGQIRKFVWCSDPGGGVIEVETAGAVEGVFGSAGEQAGRQDRILVVVVAGAVDREAPAGC